jgi:protein-L-isoaspartate O-methyltransferase
LLRWTDYFIISMGFRSQPSSGFFTCLTSAMTALAEQSNNAMVDRLIAEGALWSPRLIAAFRATPRHCFLDRYYYFHRKRNRWEEVIARDPDREQIRSIYSDRAIITRVGSPGASGAGQPISSSSQPSLMAQMLEDLKLEPGMRVLEIGSGTGYNAALISHVVGPEKVTSLDVDREVLSEAWNHLRRFPGRQVALKHADGRAGCREQAPFDRIIVTAATPDLEPAWLEQTRPEGIILAPCMFGPSLAYILRGRVSGLVFHGEPTRAAYFMSLRAEGEDGDPGEPTAPVNAELQSLPAPWKGWFDGRRPRVSWLGFIHSLAFLGLMRGMNILRSNPMGKDLVFGISSGEAACWFEMSEWKVSSDEGHKMGLSLWHDFLNLGGPRPPEYRVRAAARDVPPPGELGPSPMFVRQGVRCIQYWNIRADRDRGCWL